ncbi:MAG: nucleotidyltransferase domain-containing protein [Bacteroidota bacterium]|nr:nucleotidyltransferase domain-containing protein [Bacteroidota bacterium]
MNKDEYFKFGLTQKQFELIESLIIPKNQIEKVLIFGSRATGKFKHSSDIDLAIIGKDITHSFINRFFSELDDLPLPFMFDVINYTQISNDKLKNKIDVHGKIFFERELKPV